LNPVNITAFLCLVYYFLVSSLASPAKNTVIYLATLNLATSPKGEVYLFSLPLLIFSLSSRTRCEIQALFSNYFTFWIPEQVRDDRYPSIPQGITFNSSIFQFFNSPATQLPSHSPLTVSRFPFPACQGVAFTECEKRLSKCTRSLVSAVPPINT
jgi:hypothetical protein